MKIGMLPPPTDFVVGIGSAPVNERVEYTRTYYCPVSPPKDCAGGWVGAAVGSVCGIQEIGCILGCCATTCLSHVKVEERTTEIREPVGYGMRMNSEPLTRVSDRVHTDLGPTSFLKNFTGIVAGGVAGFVCGIPQAGAMIGCCAASLISQVEIKERTTEIRSPESVEPVTSQPAVQQGIGLFWKNPSSPIATYWV